MKMVLGVDRVAAERNHQINPVTWNSEEVINPHVLLVGDTGTGKTHRLRYLVSAAQACFDEKSRTRIHVFDGHGDIEVAGESVVEFSETTQYGFNPLAIIPDPNYGGVRKQIERFMRGISKTSHALGTKQEAVLRYILSDLYQTHGFIENNPDTWVIRPEEQITMDMSGKEDRTYLEVPYAEKDAFGDAARGLGGERGKDYDFDRDKGFMAWWVREGFHCGQMLYWGEKVWGRRQPTLIDVVRFCQRKLEAVFIGANGVSVNYLNDVRIKAAAYHRKVDVAVRNGESVAGQEKAEEEFANARKKAVGAYEQYLQSIRNGREISEVIRYESVDVLKSVLERLQNFWAMGIFRPHPAPFDPAARVRRFDLRSLDVEEQRMFVHFQTEALFYRAVRLGITDEIRDVIVVDEAHNHFSNDEDNPLNRIAKEGRKFGLALWCGSQSPTHFSTDFLTNVALKIVLGLDPSYWEGTARKLSVSRDDLKAIIPTKTALVHMKEKGRAASEFRSVVLPGDGGPAR